MLRLALVMFLTSLHANCQKLNLDLKASDKLDNTDYSSVEQPFVLIGHDKYYSERNGNNISFFKVKSEEDSLVFTLQLLTKNLDFAYILFQNKVFRFKLQTNEQDLLFTTELPDLVQDLDVSYDELFLEGDKLILTVAYNEAIENEDLPKCRFLVLNKNDLSVLAQEAISHDAIALTHKAVYLFDCQFDKVLFTNSLRNSFFIYDLNKLSYSYFGDSSLLNPTVDKIPFETRIQKFSNPKQMISNLLKFAKTIDYNEGAAFLNDSMIVVVEKRAGRNSSLRILHFYKFDKIENTYKLFCDRSFKNAKSSRKYGIFQFYYPNKFHVINNSVFQVEIDLETGSRRKIRESIEGVEKFNFAIYEYQLSL